METKEDSLKKGFYAATDKRFSIFDELYLGYSDGEEFTLFGEESVEVREIYFLCDSLKIAKYIVSELMDRIKGIDEAINLNLKKINDLESGNGLSICVDYSNIKIEYVSKEDKDDDDIHCFEMENVSKELIRRQNEVIKNSKEDKDKIKEWIDLIKKEYNILTLSA